ncbi:MAG: PilZ protein [Alphaproteobacteria bacterium]|nr:PilZ protein [Alphaproteobacteria bacterium]MDB5722617.1 PilZ protein [Alphaproteobacteria bacterium]
MYIKAELSQFPTTDGRKAERRIVNIAAALREEGVTTTEVTLVDVSEGGFKAETDSPLEEGSEVWLKLPGFEVRRSTVVWSQGRDIGCEFLVPLHPRELDLLAPPKPRRHAKDVFRRA